MPRPAVFLDRDGVLTVPIFSDGRSFAPRDLADFRVYPDAAASVARLKQAGFLVIVVTNQPDVANGLVSAATLDEMHCRLRDWVAVDDIETCTDSRANAGPRRKPGPGMLLDAARRWSIDLPASFLVGDRASDIAAGIAGGCRACVFIDRGYTAEDRPTAQAATTTDLAGAVAWILAQPANAPPRQRPTDPSSPEDP